MSVSNQKEDDLRDLVTLIGYTTPTTGAFAYRAITPQGEYSVQQFGSYWRAVPLSGKAGAMAAVDSIPEDAVRKALARKALAA